TPRRSRATVAGVVRDMAQAGSILLSRSSPRKWGSSPVQLDAGVSGRRTAPSLKQTSPKALDPRVREDERIERGLRLQEAADQFDGLGQPHAHDLRARRKTGERA